MGHLKFSSAAQSALLSFWRQDRPLAGKEQEAQGVLPGLANQGNTCFMNAVLQCVLNTPGWLAEACKSFQKPELDGSQVSGKSLLGRCFAELVHTYASTDGQALSRTSSALKNMKSAIATLDAQYAGCEQQDAYEFLGCLLEGLEDNFHKLYHREAENAKTNPSAGIIRAICGVSTHVSRTCHGCQGCFEVDSVTDTALRLPLISTAAQMDKELRKQEEATPISVEELLKTIQQPEEIDGYDCDVCRDCAQQAGHEHKRSSMTQQAGIVSGTRDVLVIVLYRFCHTLDDGPTKVRRQVSCPTKLSLDSGDYQLFGAVSHVGTSLSSGHYIAAVRSLRDELWYECDDEKVKPLNITALYAGKPVSAMRDGTDPYILFYHRQEKARDAAPQMSQESCDQAVLSPDSKEIVGSASPDGERVALSHEPLEAAQIAPEGSSSCEAAEDSTSQTQEADTYEGPVTVSTNLPVAAQNIPAQSPTQDAEYDWSMVPADSESKPGRVPDTEIPQFTSSPKEISQTDSHTSQAMASSKQRVLGANDLSPSLRTSISRLGPLSTALSSIGSIFSWDAAACAAGPYQYLMVH